MTNEIILRGTIVNLKGDNTSGKITVVCPQIITRKYGGNFKNEVYNNYPVIMYNKETQTPNIYRDFKVGDKVVIRGHVRTYFVYNDKYRESRDICNLYIDEIDHDQSKMEIVFGSKGRYYAESQNEVYLSGEVTGLNRRNDVSTDIKINVFGDESKAVTVTAYNVPFESLKSLSIGDVVDTYCMVQTVNAETRNNRRHYQSIVVLDINKH